MKTEDLTALGLSEDQIKSVFALNGTDIEKFKTDVEKHKLEATKAKEELEGVKTQLGEANTAIKGFEELDVEGIKRLLKNGKQNMNRIPKPLKIRCLQKSMNSQ